MDTRGYIRITDFGISRPLSFDNSRDASGTPGYMAPEVMCHKTHGIAVDYYALGIICYEFMTGRRPYTGRSRREIRDNILAKQVQLKRQDIPSGWSLEGADFINKLIQRKPGNRLGFVEPLDVKNHGWLRGINWQRLHEKSVDAPYLPLEEDCLLKRDISSFEKYARETSEDQLNIDRLQQDQVQELFAGYFFDSSIRKIEDSTTLNASKNPLSNRQRRSARDRDNTPRGVESSRASQPNESQPNRRLLARFYKK